MSFRERMQEVHRSSDERSGAGGAEKQEDGQEMNSEKLEELLAAGDAQDFQAQCTQYIDGHQESEEELEEFANQLASILDEIDSLQQEFSEEEVGEEKVKHTGSKSLASPREKYESVYSKRFKRKSNWPEYVKWLSEYLHDIIKTSTDKFMSASGDAKELFARRRAQEAERILRRKIEELKPQIRQEILDSMRQKSDEPKYAPADYRKIREYERTIQKRNADMTESQSENDQLSKDAEFLVGYIWQRAHLFGKEAQIYHTSDYDDLFNHADLAVETGEDQLFLIDATFATRDVGDKAYNNQIKPFRELSYPPAESMQGKKGIPFVIGMEMTGTEKFFDDFLEYEAYGRAIESGEGWVENIDKEKFSIKDEGIQKKIEFLAQELIEQALLQIEIQYDIIIEAADSAGDDAQERYEIALAEYDKAIAYLKRIKEERHTSEFDAGRSMWVRLIRNAPESVEDFRSKKGLDEPSKRLIIPE